MGILSNLFGGGATKDAAGLNLAQLALLKNEGTGYLDSALEKGAGAIGSGIDRMSGVADKFGGASTLALDALGANGANGYANARNAFQSSPGFQYQVDQARDAVLRSADAAGGVGGNMLAEIGKRAGQMANQDWGNWLDRLRGFVPAELSANTTAAGLNVPLANLYQTDAGQRLNLANNVTQGIIKGRNDVAAAETAGAGNAANLGMNLLKLGVGAASGGMGGGFSLGSLFGGR